MSSPQIWKKCSQCKKEIPLSGKYYKCSVSTCNQKRTGLAFCSMQCWDAHLPFANHKSAGAIDAIAPNHPETDGSMSASPTPPMGNTTPQKKIIRTSPSVASSAPTGDILVVQSKIRDYIAEKSGYNTSASTYDWLSMAVRILCDQAIDEARADGRKTVMDKDFKLTR